jgi:putative endonuclease
MLGNFDLESELSKGAQGEAQVLQWLVQHGYTILHQNYRCRTGEIDLIAQRGGVVVFVEVKLRLNQYFDLSEVITPTKQRRILSAARHYLAYFGDQNVNYRFDVALVHKVGADFKVEYLENAFEGSEF